MRPTFREIAFARVLVSPRQRARRTCELAGLGAAAEIEPNLAEWGYGEYEGLTPAEIDKRQPGWEVFRDGCPGGETPAAGLRSRRPAAAKSSRVGGEHRALHPRPFCPRPRGEMDRPADRRAAGVSRCAPPRSASSATTPPIPPCPSSRCGTRSQADARRALRLHTEAPSVVIATERIRLECMMP